MNESAEASLLTSGDGSEAICEGLLAALRDLAESSGEELEQIRRQRLELEVQHRALISDAASVQNLSYGCIVLAAYTALRRRLSHERALELLKAAFLQSGSWVREKTRAWLDQSPDAFRELVSISKQREVQAFGNGFSFERARDDDEAYLLNVRRCFWHDFFRSVGVPELTRVLCEFDRNWFEAIDAQRHGFRFERTTTLAYAGACCPFHFVRVRPR